MNRLGKIATLAIAAVSALGLSVASEAATYNNFSTATGTGGFGNTNTTGSGGFSDMFTFTVGAGGTLSTYVQNLSSAQSGDIDFLSAILSGPSFAMPVNYNFSTSAFGLNPDGDEQGDLFFPNLLAGVYTLVVSGTAGNTASYTGDFSVSAVPEPATWALMIGGMGVAGMALRRRRTVAMKAALA